MTLRIKSDYSIRKTLTKGLGMALLFVLGLIATQFPELLEYGLRDGVDWLFTRFPVLDTLTVGFLIGAIRNFIKYNWLTPAESDIIE